MKSNEINVKENKSQLFSTKVKAKEREIFFAESNIKESEIRNLKVIQHYMKVIMNFKSTGNY
jgi:hypothetical protein